MTHTDLHMHTCFSDGKNTPEEMIRSAMEKGLTTVGISDHGFAPFAGYGLTRKSEVSYFTTMQALKLKYRGKIRVLCGVELDYHAPTPTLPYDYVIGSVHFIRAGDGYIPIDESVEDLIRGAEEAFDGDRYALVEAYFDTVADVVNKTRAHVIGHFDLIAKFCEQSNWIDPTHPRYRAAWQKAADRLLETGVPFEINTGAISRGYRTEPYPSAEIRAYIREHGGKFMLSSDSHQADTVAFQFDRWAE